MTTDRKYWQRHARRYDRVTLIINRRFRDMARAVAEVVQGAQDVLEVAAGTGLVSEVVAPGVARYMATDATAEMLEQLRVRLDAVDNVEMRVADALALDFPDSSFDAVIIANLLHLLPEPSRALGEARRVLRPGGKLLVPTFAHGQGIRARIASRVLGLSGFAVVTRFRGEQLETLVSDADFKVLDSRWFAGILPIHLVVGQRD